MSKKTFLPSILWTIPEIISPSLDLYSENMLSFSASLIRWRITCFAVWAAILQ